MARSRNTRTGVTSARQSCLINQQQREGTEQMRELLIARHGQAVCNLTGIIAGPRTCTGLTSLGRAQAVMLASRLRREARTRDPITAIHTSPRRRARETAGIVDAALGLSFDCDANLRHPHYRQRLGGRPRRLSRPGLRQTRPPSCPRR